MKIIDPGHAYLLSDQTEIQFIKREKGELIHDGTTSEELLQVLIDRTNTLDRALPCLENAQALAGMAQALAAFRARTRRREAQGVETTDKPHQSGDDPFEYLDRKDPLADDDEDEILDLEEELLDEWSDEVEA